MKKNKNLTRKREPLKLIGKGRLSLAEALGVERKFGNLEELLMDYVDLPINEFIVNVWNDTRLNNNEVVVLLFTLGVAHTEFFGGDYSDGDEK
jgi:hypothetical protein